MTEKTNPYHEIAAFLAQFELDPLGFIYACFPWGEGELEGKDGPDQWQIDFFRDLGQRLKENLGKEDQVIRTAVAAANGVGKSFSVSMLILWALSTRADTRITVTANTETQLRTKTMPEVSKWFRLFIGKSLFQITATAIYSKDEEHEKTWRCDFTPWSETNYVAFQGLHNEGKRLLLIMDEASGIHPLIWEAVEGSLTDKATQIIWAVFGNPTHPDGRFFDCFHDHKEFWVTKKVDGRDVKITNKEQIKTWIKQYGLDSDFVRTRVMGEFPIHGVSQFISTESVRQANQVNLVRTEYASYPIILGVDPARFGNDSSVIVVRQGPKTFKPIRYQKLDTMELAGKVVEVFSQYGRQGGICIDAVGVGAGLFDFLRSRNFPVVEIQSAAKAHDFKQYANRRAELYGKLRDWLEQGGVDLPNDKDLTEQLTCFEAGSNKRMQIQLESKDDIKKRIGKSPDVSDALAYTFAYEEAVRLAHMTRAKPIKRVQW